MRGSERTRVRVNIISIAGGAIGLLAAIFLPWITIYAGGWAHAGPSLTDLMTTPTVRTYPVGDLFGNVSILLGGILILIGAVVSFTTPLGGIPQIIGCTLFYSTISQILGTHIGRFDVLYTTYLGLGFWLGIIAGGLCLLSIIVPIGLNRPWNKLNLKERLLTISSD